MGKLRLSPGGGGGDLDVITAGAADVAAPKVIVDKDGEPVTGTMPIASTGSYWNRDLGVGIEPDNFYSFQPYGKYELFDSRGSLHRIPIDRLRNVIGATSDKIMSGRSIAGVDGTATNDAVLDPAYLVEGYSGYDDGIKKNGTCKRQNGQTITPTTYQQVISCAGKYMMGNVVINKGNIYQESYINVGIVGLDNFINIFGQAERLNYVQYTVPFSNIRSVILFLVGATGVFTYASRDVIAVGCSDSGHGGQSTRQFNKNSGEILSNGTVKLPVLKSGTYTAFTTGW